MANETNHFGNIAREAPCQSLTSPQNQCAIETCQTNLGPSVIIAHWIPNRSSLSFTSSSGTSINSDERNLMTTIFKAMTALLLISIANIGSAATVHLSHGEIATIIANENTTVTCGTDHNVSCKSKTDTLANRIKACINNNTGIRCVDMIWPGFKERNPNCVDDGSYICVIECSRDPRGRSSECDRLCQ